MTPDGVVLLGCQRSGTTALAHALAEAFAEANGTFVVNGKLPYLLHRWLTRRDLEDRHLRVDEILHALDRRPPGGPGAARWRSAVEMVLRELAADVAEGVAGTDPIALGRRILRDAHKDVSVWGDKYNEYLLHLEHLDSLLPEARYVMLVRHPTDVARSMLAWTGDRPWRPTTEAAALAKWETWNRRWLDHAGSLDPARWIVIEYDALCRGEETARLEEFTGVPLWEHLRALRPPREPDRDLPLPPSVLTTWSQLLDHARPSTLPGDLT
ncbi:sulfotransferase family protein [Aeromicrobium fastidiosum]|uniref:sulfotransferase family protein n=1 Tax=Aeromicrobium fastidiosum TaxID=52699 RepID=UPI00165FB596|nr:sulfotransferase [Aeromicrobium fastidiosum]MBP2390293.1 hypothetical protein [Aeromicrobium fastidiosum]